MEGEVKHDPKKIIYNYSEHVLTPSQESILIKGLNFSLPPKKLKYEDFMFNFEHLYRDLSQADKDNKDILFVKNELRNIAYSSFKVYNKKDHRFDNISKKEHSALLELLKLDNIIISKADKGNVVVILGKKVLF